MGQSYALLICASRTGQSRPPMLSSGRAQCNSPIRGFVLLLAGVIGEAPIPLPVCQTVLGPDLPGGPARVPLVGIPERADVHPREAAVRCVARCAARRQLLLRVHVRAVQRRLCGDCWHRPRNAELRVRQWTGRAASTQTGGSPLGQPPAPVAKARARRAPTAPPVGPKPAPAPPNPAHFTGSVGPAG